MSTRIRTFVSIATIVGTILSHAEAFLPTDSTALSPAAPRGFPSPFPSHPELPSSTSTHATTTTTTTLRMGILDSLSRFLDQREGDFVRLEDMKEQFFGPGPAVLLYNVPDTIDDAEVFDILSDGAPTATSKGISLERIAATDLQKSDGPNRAEGTPSLVDMSLQEALETVIQRKSSPSPSALSKDDSTFRAPAWTGPTPPTETGSPVVIFSGFSNTEMMASYNILGEEIYKETASYGGPGMYLACATAVPNAMEKPLRQVLTEISGDHAEAMKQEDSE